MKEFLTAKGVPFTSKNIRDDEAARAELQGLLEGDLQVPVIAVDGEVILGFDRTRLQKVLRLS